MSFKMVGKGKTKKQKISKLNEQNKVFAGKSPKDIICWALSIANKPIITSNFGPFSASLLHAVTSQSPKINVIWVDTGYNTSQTYKYALGLIKQLNLNINIYVPKESVGYRDIKLGVPSVEDPKAPINILWLMFTNPAAGVIITKPTTAPIHASITLILCPLIPSITSQVIIHIADAVFVVTNAKIASSFAPSAEPELNPNQPNHNIPVPSKT